MNSMYDRLLDRISFTALRRIIVVFLALSGAIAGSVIFGNMPELLALAGRSEPRFGGHEVAEWHITSEGLVRVHSRISLSKCPANGTFMPIVLPYESGKIEAALLDGSPVEYIDVPAGLDREPGCLSEPGLYIALNTPGPALRNSRIEVIWSFPFDELPREDGCGYRIRERGLIPVKSYAIVAVLDEGCGFELSGDHPELRMTQPFSWMWREYISCQMGTCCLSMRPKRPADTTSPTQ